ncbi:hypothetical protein ANN_27752 [Periplaneta americana]|uniref:HTH CENPB-type domain-containing protein n=1 Tax=Periplaneta americana TaxID=6978 RepID=A0ABQ8RV62_PERAM|nr:hypothetical protein ANN_27752 [Periplaneta americana]
MTERGETPPDVMLTAVRCVHLNNVSIRQAAKEYNINYRTLARYCQKITPEQCHDSSRNIPYIPVGYIKNRQIFMQFEETELVEYILQASDIYFRLSPKEVRMLAYQVAVANSKEMLKSWEENKVAGADWLSAFIKRHPVLSIRSPQATSLSRAGSFNRTNVDKFFNNLDTVMQRHKLQVHEIWNMDKTGVTTIQKPDRVVARMGYKDHFIAGGPPGSSGCANPSGWMQEENFLQFFKHFHSVAKSTQDKQVLLLLDNHGSHLSIDGLNFAKANGIIMLSFLPHCSHRLHPLDQAVFGPFKRYYNTAADAWMLNNPSKTMTIYDVPSIVSTAYPLQ